MAPTLAGALVGIQAALLSWILVVTPVVAAFTATAGQDFNAGVSWADAARFGSSLWVLGHFGWTVMGTGSDQTMITISPLGLPLISALAAAAMSRLTAARGWPLVGGGLVGFLAVDALIGWVLAGPARPSAWAALLGGAAAAGAGLLWANRPNNGDLLGRREEALGPRLPAGLTASLKAATMIAGLVIAGALALAVALGIGGWRRFADLFRSLDTGTIGGIALAAACLSLAPNLVAWLIAYLAGPGFSVGSGTSFSVFETVGGAEPALPLVGLLPTADPPSFAVALIAVPVLAGIMAGWWLQRQLDGPWWQGIMGAALAGLVAAVGLAAFVALAGGAGGPGRLGVIGASFWPLAGWLWLEAGIGAIIGVSAVSRPWSRRGR
jgi:hypothetical protein